MLKANHPPFQARVASVAIVTTVAVLVAACLSFLLQQWGVARQDSRKHYQALAGVVASTAGPSVVAGDRPAAIRTLTAAGRAESLIDARLTDARGQVIALYAAPRTPGPYATRTVDSASTPVTANGKVVATLTLRSRQPSLTELLPKFLALTGALFFGASGIALFVAQGLARRVTAPIERLSQAMADVAASGEFTRVAEEADDDVFHRLTESFNDL